MGIGRVPEKVEADVVVVPKRVVELAPLALLLGGIGPGQGKRDLADTAGEVGTPTRAGSEAEAEDAGALDPGRDDVETPRRPAQLLGNDCELGGQLR